MSFNALGLRVAVVLISSGTGDTSVTNLFARFTIEPTACKAVLPGQVLKL